MSNTSQAPGWYPESDESYQRWWDGVAWTEYRRVSRFPGFVERRGGPVFRGRTLFPSGDERFARLVRLAQTLLLIALLLIVIGLPAGWVGAILTTGEVSLAHVLVPLVTALVLILVALVPMFRVLGIGMRVREAHARGDFHLELGPDGNPKIAPAVQSRPPGWE